VSILSEITLLPLPNPWSGKNIKKFLDLRFSAVTPPLPNIQSHQNIISGRRTCDPVLNFCLNKAYRILSLQAFLSHRLF
jgi:hypothetical protein